MSISNLAKSAMTSCVDPSTANDFNPQNPVNPMLRSLSVFL